MDFCVIICIFFYFIDKVIAPKSINVSNKLNQNEKKNLLQHKITKTKMKKIIYLILNQ